MPGKVSVFLVACAALFFAGFAGCGVETAGEYATYSVAARGVTSNGTPSSFESQAGWKIELTDARALVGPVYFYAGEARASLFDTLLGINSAYACAAHSQFSSGETLGQIPLQFGVDLLSGETELGQVDGARGTVRSVELHLQDPGAVDAGNDMAEAMTGSTVVLEGTASKDGQSVPFIAEVTLSEEGTVQIVDSISASAPVEQGSNVMIDIELDRWFAAVDFSSLTEQDGEGRFIVSAGTQAFGAMTYSVRARSAFSIKSDM